MERKSQINLSNQIAVGGSLSSLASNSLVRFEELVPLIQSSSLAAVKEEREECLLFVFHKDGTYEVVKTPYAEKIRNFSEQTDEDKVKLANSRNLGNAKAAGEFIGTIIDHLKR